MIQLIIFLLIPVITIILYERRRKIETTGYWTKLLADAKDDSERIILLRCGVIEKKLDIDLS